MKKEKCYVLDMFPYPSGDGLHVGHPKGYIATDIYSRYKKMNNFDVIHPMGWDAFGLPAEQYAIKNKINPKQAVEKNIANFKSQLEKINLDYDWGREISTTDPKFYKWTQWIFKQLYKKGLAFESFEPINWCPSCKTGLANEDLEGNACERCGTVVEKKPLRQWNLKITNYADRLISDLDTLNNWPEWVKTAQKNWIGKSEGSEIDFRIVGEKEINFSEENSSGLVGYGTSIDMNVSYSFENEFKIFTTRADTLFGCTYTVLAPEHKLVKELLEDSGNKNVLQNKEEVKKYLEEVKLKTDIERGAEGKEKTGVKLEGVMAINPANQKEVPVYIADYVLASYGTGAIMAVPAHDERDFEFADKYGIEIKNVVTPKDIYRGIVVGTTLKDNLSFKKELDSNNIKYELATSKISGREQIRFEGNKKDLDVLIPIIQENIIEGNWVDILGSQSIILLKNSINVDYMNNQQEWFDKMNVKESFLNGQKNFWHLLYKNDFLKPFLCYSEEGLLINSEEFDGLTSEEARTKITEYVGGKVVTKYKLRDWVFARQRYWGEPFPVVYATNENGERDVNAGPIMVADSELPVLLPAVESYEPTGTGESPLAIIDSFVNVYGYTNDDGEFVSVKNEDEKVAGQEIKLFKRETNTMPQWAGSSWYYLRFLDPHNDNFLIDPKVESEWQTKDNKTVDVYVGGDHATRHLIYARFWHKFLYDIGVVTTLEPFNRLEFLGFILAEDGTKMSKSKGNTINPDTIVDEYGSDAFRIYEMFMAPFEATAVWSTSSIKGVKRFVERVEKLKNNTGIPCADENIIHQTVKKVGEDIESFKFNTCVSQLMICLNTFEEKGCSKEELENFLKILAPFAPTLCKDYLKSDWPTYDENKLVANTVNIALQINGKLRATFQAELNTDDEAVKELAKNTDAYKKYILEEKVEIKKIIVVKNKIVNIVI